MNSSLKFWLKVTRLYQCVIAGLASWITAVLCEGSTWITQQNVVAFGVSTFGCLGAFLMHYAIRHDTYKSKWKDVHHQYRPALFLHLGAYTFAFSMTVAALFLPLVCLFIVTINFAALYIYATVIRHWSWKNLIASFLCITPILIGWFAVQHTNPVIPFLLVSAFCMYMAREILKDMEDLDVDRGKRFTMVMRFGPIATMRVASSFLFVAVLFYGLAAVTIPHHSMSVIIPFVIGAILFFQFALRLLLAREYTSQDYRTIDAGVVMLMLALLAARAGF